MPTIETKLTITDVLAAIAKGELDGKEKAIKRAFILRSRKAFKKGDRIRIVRISPKWLEGLTGKIVGLARNPSSKRFDVELDEAPNVANRWGTGLEPKLQHGIPFTCLEPLE